MTHPTKSLKTLLMRALRIEDAIGREQRKRWPDSLRLLQLKKLRLAIKDRLYRLTRRSFDRLSV